MTFFMIFEQKTKRNSFFTEISGLKNGSWIKPIPISNNYLKVNFYTEFSNF